MKFRLLKSRLAIDVGLFTLEFHCPVVNWNTAQRGVICKTMVAYTYPTWVKDGHCYPWRHAAVLLVLGFGIGIAYKHYDNHYYKIEFDKWSAI